MFMLCLLHTVCVGKESEHVCSLSVGCELQLSPSGAQKPVGRSALPFLVRTHLAFVPEVEK